MPPLHPHPHFTFFTRSISCPLSGNELFTDASPSLVAFREDGPQARIIAREAEAAEPSGFHHQRSDRMVPSSPISFPPLGNPQEQFTTNAHNFVPPFPGSAGSRSLTFDPRPKSIINAAEDEHLAGVHRGLLIGESEQLFKFYDSVPAGTGLTDSARPNNYVNQSLSDSKLPYLNTSLPSPQALTSSVQTEPHSVAPTLEYDLILRITSLLNRIQPPGLTGLLFMVDDERRVQFWRNHVREYPSCLPDSFFGAPAFSPLGQDIRVPAVAPTCAVELGFFRAKT
ncbi:uncharacterized protein EI90DRAFT_3088235 [Cantharellus anzutake]|uniref:uncharacterized protein n=1 Tax=Cantharellus anzutake TaxID=1750568 RepID=UPI001903DDAA|nr:uncharacterized protein EI90DRAFT_3088235 [Cantharellus anzutake]KAF8315474.1 hypothetical protein EI90DRAFT_3088235 [Cantharellus anzutake]